jgi:hypothetical protein
MGLSKDDIFWETSKHMIQALLRSYLSGVAIGESLSIKTFFLEAQKIIFSMNIAHEEHPSFC